jgi:hypothetical protein
MHSHALQFINQFHDNVKTLAEQQADAGFVFGQLTQAPAPYQTVTTIHVLYALFSPVRFPDARVILQNVTFVCSPDLATPAAIETIRMTNANAQYSSVPPGFAPPPGSKARPQTGNGQQNSTASALPVQNAPKIGPSDKKVATWVVPTIASVSLEAFPACMAYLDSKMWVESGSLQIPGPAQTFQACI